MTKKALRIGIVAPSSVVPPAEFQQGVDHLRNQGFTVDVHPTVLEQDYFYPAPDETRANAILEYAFRGDLDVLWCARGGYGATHLLPLLKKATTGKNPRKKPKKKTLVGFSDATALLEFVRVNWGWKTIHAPMPSLLTFSSLKPGEWNSLLEQLGLAPLSSASSFLGLKPVFVPKKAKTITAPLVGGNLSVWNSMIGTPFTGNAKGKILFLEDIQENIARINRMLHHLDQSGGLKGVKAIVLGDFLDCNDTVMNIDGKPIRKTYPSDEALDFVFRLLGERLKIPVWKNLPVGHGPNYHALSLGKRYQLSPNGKLTLAG